ncbi:hypothetical protein ACFPVX_04905 [Cohnella faecalis]|uniref:Uncharacterized protein n=1 Tax=Cohnella faecalis TaxID=2315694 RepID=A0A398CVR7_9BACL|nr:hypothetical protein [Cohnella faecalis]RIE03967.1 hypothetical protein D3H35_08385 [Cohnella faecalis]
MNDNKDQVPPPPEGTQAFSPAFQPVNDYSYSQAPIKNSGTGIASFVLGIIGILGLVGTTMALFVSFASKVDVGTLVDDAGNLTMTEQELIDKLGSTIVLGFMYPLLLLIAFIGLILGIIGIAQKNRKKTFAVLGTIFSALPLLLVVLGLIVALAAGGAG